MNSVRGLGPKTWTYPNTLSQQPFSPNFLHAESAVVDTRPSSTRGTLLDSRSTYMNLVPSSEIVSHQRFLQCGREGLVLRKPNSTRDFFPLSLCKNTSEDILGQHIIPVVLKEFTCSFHMFSEPVSVQHACLCTPGLPDRGSL